MVNIQSAARPATLNDRMQIANLMYFEPHVHRHLDWRAPLDWLGAPEYWVLEQFGSVLAALACPPEPEDVAWLRLFAHSSSISLVDAWAALWKTASTVLQGRNLTVAAITASDWFGSLLTGSGFVGRQQIVVLEQNSFLFQERPLLPDIQIRPMLEADLPAVAAVDSAGFDRLWKNSLDTLRFGFSQAGFACVAQIDGEIVGYQISTRNSLGVHLARLAVLPQQQRKGIGYFLVQELLHQARSTGLYRLTVNTQNDNHASLALYQKMGFVLTGEHYTVYTYPC
jgi:ribosomal protein S18 acetylase RimI-like enzyme